MKKKCKCLKSLKSYGKSGLIIEFSKNISYYYDIFEDIYILYADQIIPHTKNTFQDKLILSEKKFKHHFLDPIVKRKEISDYINNLN